MTRAATRILLVRHGHHDPRGRFLQHRCTGLDATGRRQADLLARRLHATLGHADHVLASFAARSLQTAVAVAEGLDLHAPEQTCDLCEMHPGQAEGLTSLEMNERFGPNYRSVPGAEYFPDWLPGAVARLRAIAHRFSGRTVVAITHTGVIKASFSAFGEMPGASAEAVLTDNTGITEWTRPTDPDDLRHGVWALVRHNDASHI